MWQQQQMLGSETGKTWHYWHGYCVREIQLAANTRIGHTVQGLIHWLIKLYVNYLQGFQHIP